MILEVKNYCKKIKNKVIYILKVVMYMVFMEEMDL